MKRLRNEDYRLREYLLPTEIEALLEAAKDSGKHSHRNYTMILLGFRHGLRASELCNMTWEQVELETASIFIKRLKGSRSGFHPLKKVEIAALKKLKRTNPPSEYLFPSVGRVDTPISTARFQQIMRIVGNLAGLGDKVHPHQLRHSCGYFMGQTEDLRVIQVYLGHENVSNTVRYTELNTSRFANIFPD